ncbi:uncharacterized protein LOC129287730 [Prosopis cineraria]|nr:uncharacterized protein LOC129287730 [Prosopis cineraria]
MSCTELNSHHVFLWCDYAVFTKYEDIKYNPKISFEFSVTYSDGVLRITRNDCSIQACGVCPIYASEYHSFLEQKKLMGTRKKTTEIMEFARFSLKREKRGHFETSIIPKWFAHQRSETESSCIRISVQLLPGDETSSIWWGFIFCFYIPQFSLKERDRSHSRSACYWEDRFYKEGPKGWHYSMIKWNSDNVFLWYDPFFNESVIDFVERKGSMPKSEIFKQVLTFEFEFGDCLIKECGFRLMYESEYKQFLQENKMKLE